MPKVPDDIMRDRQKWFWRRTTLQSVIGLLSFALIHSAMTTAGLQNDWPTVATQALLTGAIVWLVTIYFGSVNDANKLSKLVGSVGKAIGDAREKDEKEEN